MHWHKSSREAMHNVSTQKHKAVCYTGAALTQYHSTYISKH
jgi:hypothetical protein